MQKEGWRRPKAVNPKQFVKAKAEDLKALKN